MTKHNKKNCYTGHPNIYFELYRLMRTVTFTFTLTSVLKTFQNFKISRYWENISKLSFHKIFTELMLNSRELKSNHTDVFSSMSNI